jgi:hypothetical protein
MRISKENLRVINQHTDIGESYDTGLARLLDVALLSIDEHGSVDEAREALRRDVAQKTEAEAQA